MSVITVETLEAFNNHIFAAVDKLVVCYFTASWCGACKLTSPEYERLAATYAKAVCLKVDVDKTPDVAQIQDIYLLPTFIGFKNNLESFRIEGTDVTELENRMKEESHSDTEEVSNNLISLSSYIQESHCECLNESEEHPLSNALSLDKSLYLESDADAQMMISITFTENVKIFALILQGPRESGPKDIRIYRNQTKTLSFDDVDQVMPLQVFHVSALDLEKGNPIRLRYVRFQNIKNLQIYIENNQTGTEKTRLNYISFIGRAVSIWTPPGLSQVVGAGEEEAASSSKPQEIKGEIWENIPKVEKAQKGKSETLSVEGGSVDTRLSVENVPKIEKKENKVKSEKLTGEVKAEKLENFPKLDKKENKVKPERPSENVPRLDKKEKVKPEASVDANSRRASDDVTSQLSADSKAKEPSNRAKADVERKNETSKEKSAKDSEPQITDEGDEEDKESKNSKNTKKD